MIFVTQKIPTKRFSALLLMCLAAPVSASASTGLVISQVQTGGINATNQEYVSVRNNTDQAVDVTNTCLVYSSASDASHTQLACLQPPKLDIKLYLPPGQSVAFATNEFAVANPAHTTDKIFTAGIGGTAGHVKLLDESKSILDVVGWGSATKPETTSAISPPAGKVLQRKLGSAPYLQDTNNNSADFYVSDLAATESGKLYEEMVMLTCTNCSATPPIISEILPDAEGADAGKEFIEIFNPGVDTIDLQDYALQLGPGFTKTYRLPSIVLEPGQYVALTDSQTSLILPNTGAVVRLINPRADVVSEVTYSGSLESRSLALFDTTWLPTFLPTPGLANILLEREPCEGGKVFDRESESCKAVSVAAVPTVCKENQTRNLETGRCRNNAVVPAASVCKVGQVKNPETGRCKNSVVVASTACPAGQQRNTETNRCRKIVPVPGATKVTDVPAPLVANTMKWWVAGIGAMSAAGYALFEWRREVFTVALGIKSKLMPS